MSKLAALLGGMTLNDLAKEILGSQGRRGDTQLAHVNRREAAILKDMGGSGTTNPNTGMQEFYDGYDVDPYGGFPDIQAQSFDSAPVETVDVTQPQPSFDGQPTPSYGGGEAVSPPQEISDIGFGPGRFTPEYGGADVSGMGRADFGRAMADITQPSGGIGEQIRGVARGVEGIAKEYPTLTRAAGAAAMGLPGMIQAGRARREAAGTRAEMERMAAPIRQAGEQLIGAGQRGELTAPQQQQIQAARAAARQSLAQRGVTSGTAAQQAENRITELAQRFAQQNIDNGVRLIGAANTYNAQAIQQAYRMNADAANMTQAYFTNLMRAFGSIPSEQPPTQQTGRR